jgi:tetratricopeptide (TPR) repeat protein
MDWSLAQEDPYYQARAMEEKARRDGRPESWREFGEFKERKGSYTLAALGYMNCAISQENAGRRAEAGASYERAFAACRKGGCKDLAVVVASRWAQTLEPEAGAEAYEQLGAFCEGQGALFLAADAYEHAAELLQKAGRDVSGYSKPVELWGRNALYWERQGHPDDASWSRRHVALYQRLTRRKAG